MPQKPTAPVLTVCRLLKRSTFVTFLEHFVLIVTITRNAQWWHMQIEKCAEDSAFDENFLVDENDCLSFFNCTLGCFYHYEVNTCNSRRRHHWSGFPVRNKIRAGPAVEGIKRLVRLSWKCQLWNKVGSTFFLQPVIHIFCISGLALIQRGATEKKKNRSSDCLFLKYNTLVMVFGFGFPNDFVLDILYFIGISQCT